MSTNDEPNVTPNVKTDGTPNVELNAEMTRSFLSDAISNLASCIQLIDTKVSIIMAAIAAIIAVTVAPGEGSLANAYTRLSANTCHKWHLIGLIGILFLGLVVAIVSGALAIHINPPMTRKDTAWYFSTKKPKNKAKSAVNDAPKSIDRSEIGNYVAEVAGMGKQGIIMTMAEELWKLNSINEKKVKRYKWQLFSFLVAAGAFVAVTLFCIFAK